MWEITIKSSKEHSYMLEYIEKNLITHLRDKIVVGKYCFFDCCLSVGTKKENEAEVWGFLKRVLCDVFCQYFKEEFLKNNLACFLNNNPYSKVVLKAFTYFDLELERSISYRLIDYSNCIVLESAMHFKLNFLIKKWGNLCNLFNQNANLLISNETFLNLLKYLIENLNCKTGAVVLSFEDSVVVYENEQHEYIFLSLPNDVVELVCLLIDLSPSKILVHQNLSFKAMQDVVFYLFNSRISF